MKITHLPALLVLLAVVPIVGACAANPGSATDPVPLVTPLSLEPPPIYALLGYRRELELTSEQVTSLDRIAQGIQEENRPLVRELQGAARERSRQPGVLIVDSPEAERILEEIRANQRKAGDAVAELLDEDQRATVCRLWTRDEAVRGRGAERAQRDATTDGSGRGPLARAGWPWCEGERSASAR
jgi:hypothetical protein